MRRFYLHLLSLLGFSAGTSGCSPAVMYGTPTIDDLDVCMYGTPTVEYMVKGKVTDTNGTPIKGIVVSSGNNTPSLSATTGEDGTFVTNTVSDMDPMGTLTFTDVDGEQNGGSFSPKSLDISKLSKEQVKDSDGAWFNGGYELTANVELEKQK